MEEYNACISKYQKLLLLLDDDAREIARAIQGELLSSYLSILEAEKVVIQNEINIMQSKL